MIKPEIWYVIIIIIIMYVSLVAHFNTGMSCIAMAYSYYGDTLYIFQNV